MLDEYVFMVDGSALDTYEVRFLRRSAVNISAYCTCRAGQNGVHCKHRTRILEGITTGIVSDNQCDVANVVTWVPGSDLGDALDNIRKIEKELSVLKRKLSAAKKALAQEMLR